MRLFINKILEIPVDENNKQYIEDWLPELKECTIINKFIDNKLIIYEQKCTLEEFYINNFLACLHDLEVKFKIELMKDFSWGVDMRLDLD